MILTDRAAIRRFKRRANFHSGLAWFNDSDQKMMIKVKKSWHSSEMVVHDYADVKWGPDLMYRVTSKVDNRYQSGATLDDIFGERENDQDCHHTIVYHTGLRIAIAFKDGTELDLIKANDRLEKGTLSDILNMNLFDWALRRFRKHVYKDRLCLDGDMDRN